MTPRRILIAVDDSPIAAHAADVGFDLARSVGGEVALIFVIDPSQNYEPESGVPAAELIAFAEKDGRRLLHAIGARAGMHSPPLEFVPVGSPGAEIAKSAREWPADIVVVGSHGRGGVSRLLVGSVAEAVMRRAPCPVLVVRSPS
jgi:universal stress protein A